MAEVSIEAVEDAVVGAVVAVTRELLLHSKQLVMKTLYQALMVPSSVVSHAGVAISQDMYSTIGQVPLQIQLVEEDAQEGSMLLWNMHSLRLVVFRNPNYF